MKTIKVKVLELLKKVNISHGRDALECEHGFAGRNRYILAVHGFFAVIWSFCRDLAANLHDWARKTGEITEKYKVNKNNNLVSIPHGQGTRIYSRSCVGFVG